MVIDARPLLETLYVPGAPVTELGALQNSRRKSGKGAAALVGEQNRRPLGHA